MRTRAATYVSSYCYIRVLTAAGGAASARVALRGRAGVCAHGARLQVRQLLHYCFTVSCCVSTHIPQHEDTYIPIFLKSELLHYCITEKSDGGERLECSLHKDHLTADSRSYVRVWRPDPSKAGGASTAGGPAAEHGYTSILTTPYLVPNYLVGDEHALVCRASEFSARCSA